MNNNAIFVRKNESTFHLLDLVVNGLTLLFFSLFFESFLMILIKNIQILPFGRTDILEKENVLFIVHKIGGSLFSRIVYTSTTAIDVSDPFYGF